LALTLAEREEISRGVVSGSSIRSIAASIGRSASTVSRELRRNGDLVQKQQGVLTMHYSSLLGALSSVRNRYQKSAATLTAGVLATGLLLCTSPAQAVQIDDFNDNNLGTEISVFNGVYTHDSGNIASESEILWNGVGGDFLRVDFTDGGASDRIRTVLEIASFDLNSPRLEFFITTSGTSSASTGTFGFTAGVSGIYDVPLDELAWERPGNNPLNFEDVLSLQLTVLPGDADFVKIDNIATTVPVPAAVWLFGSGLLGLIGIARRKKTA
jgi:hypothetical protein